MFASESYALNAVEAKFERELDHDEIVVVEDSTVHAIRNPIDAPFVSPCWFGADIPSKEELIACRYSIEEIRMQIGADSLGFLSLGALRRIVPDADCGFCDGCFTGNYPINA